MSILSARNFGPHSAMLTAIGVAVYGVVLGLNSKIEPTGAQALQVLGLIVVATGITLGFILEPDHQDASPETDPWDTIAHNNRLENRLRMNALTHVASGMLLFIVGACFLKG